MFAPTVTPGEVATALGRKPEDAAVAAAHGAAVAELTTALASAFRPVPPEVADELVYRVTRAMLDARRTQTTGQQLTTAGSGEQGARAPRDPLAPVVSILARYVVPL